MRNTWLLTAFLFVLLGSTGCSQQHGLNLPPGVSYDPNPNAPVTFSINCWTVGTDQYYCTSENIDYTTAQSRFAAAFAGKAQPSSIFSAGTAQPSISACNGYHGVPAETAEGCGAALMDPRCQYSVPINGTAFTSLKVTC